MTKAIATKVVYNYLGQDPKGLLRLRSDSEALLVSGTLYAVSTPKKPTAGKAKVALVALKTSPSYTKAESDQRFAVDPISRTPYRHETRSQECPNQRTPNRRIRLSFASK